MRMLTIFLNYTHAVKHAVWYVALILMAETMKYRRKRCHQFNFIFKKICFLLLRSKITTIGIKSPES